MNRRDFLRFLVATAGTVLSRKDSLGEESGDIILSDPEILGLYAEILNGLKEGSIEYPGKRDFEPIAEIHESLLKFDRGSREWRDLKEKAEQQDANFLRLKDTQEDNLDGIADKKKYIERNRIRYQDVVKAINSSKIVLFGETHTVDEHQEIELQVLEDMEKSFLSYGSEDFTLGNADDIKRVLKGEPAATKSLDSGAIKRLKTTRKHRLPVIITDLSTDLKGKIAPGYDRWSDPKRNYVRARIFARQIQNALRHGYRVFSSFGDLHVQQSQIPSYLKDGPKALVITTSNMSAEAYRAAMDVSGGKGIFFSRGDHIVYLTKGLTRLERYR